MSELFVIKSDGQYQDGRFWLQDSCPTCGHSAASIYKPRLLDGPVEQECRRHLNPVWRDCPPCGAKWGVAADKIGIDKIVRLMALAYEKELLLMRIKRIEQEASDVG